MKALSARFPGWCTECRRKFPEGTSILWGAGEGSRHQGQCPPCDQCTAQKGHDVQCPQADPPKGQVFHRKAYFAGRPAAPVSNTWKQDTYGDETGIQLSDLEVGGRGTSRYAIPFNGEGEFEGHLFVRVDKPKEGKWAGYVFVKWVFGDREETIGREWPGESYRSLRKYEGRFDYPLNELWADPEKAKAKYGQIIGQCGNCGKRLTDEVSRERGIGPDCWEMLAAYRKVLVP